MRLLLTAIFAFYACLFSGCASTRSAVQALPERERLLVGTWEGDISFARWVITRHADHTFTERAIRIYDYAKPAIRAESTGTWRIDGNRYCWRYTSVSHPKWWSQVGREACEEILELSPTHLNYFPEDSPLISERKLSGSEAFWLLHQPLRLAGTYRSHPTQPSNQ